MSFHGVFSTIGLETPEEKDLLHVILKAVHWGL